MDIVAHSPLAEHKNPVVRALIAQVFDRLLGLTSARQYLLCAPGSILGRAARRESHRAIQKMKASGYLMKHASSLRVKTMYRQRREAIADVLGIAIYFAKFNTGVFEVSIKRIARYTGISRPRIQRAMNDLRATNAIQNFGRSNHRVMRRQINPNLYKALGIATNSLQKLAAWKETQERFQKAAAEKRKSSGLAMNYGALNQKEKLKEQRRRGPPRYHPDHQGRLGQSLGPTKISEITQNLLKNLKTEK